MSTTVLEEEDTEEENEKDTEEEVPVDEVSETIEEEHTALKPTCLKLQAQILFWM